MSDEYYCRDLIEISKMLFWKGEKKLKILSEYSSSILQHQLKLLPLTMDKHGYVRIDEAIETINLYFRNIITKVIVMGFGDRHQRSICQLHK